MQGLSFNSMKKHPALVPLFFCVAFGASAATLYTLRLATRSPDVSWTPKTKPEPWNDYKEKEYKLVASKQENAVKFPAPQF